MNVAVIDDDPFVMMVAIERLQQTGIKKIRKYNDSKQALKELSNKLDELDAIFLDKNMPEISGDELAARFKDKRFYNSRKI